MTYLKLFSGLFALALAPAARGDTTIDPAQNRPVLFELGKTQFEPGDFITIKEVRGSTDRIHGGGTYSVSGTYTLASQDEADLSLFATSTNRTPTRVDPAQTMRVTKGTGAFSLTRRMTDEGYLHVSFYSVKTRQSFGGVYFGQGEGVLRDNHFGHHPTAGPELDHAEPISSAGPNQILYDFLGNPVPPPANMDPAYTKDGLVQAMEMAAKKAGIALLKLEIDDSEFPFLVGIKFAGPTDKPKFIEQIHHMPSYKASGGVGGEITYAMNIVPYEAYPANVGQRIYRRMILREAVLHDKMLGTP